MYLPSVFARYREILTRMKNSFDYKEWTNKKWRQRDIAKATIHSVCQNYL